MSTLMPSGSGATVGPARVGPSTPSNDWIPPVFGEVWGDLKSDTLHTAYLTGTEGARRTSQPGAVTSRPGGALSRKAKGQHLMYRPLVESQTGNTVTSPSLLCPAMGARGLCILQGIREGVLEERILEEVELWTQTLLARDELDGWSCLRPSRRARTQLKE